jgi:hypothetical protein
MHHQKNYNLYSFESKEEKEKRMLNTILSQLGSFIYNMISFGMPSSDVQLLIEDFIKYYDIDKDNSEQLLKSLEEFNHISKSKDIDNTSRISSNIPLKEEEKNNEKQEENDQGKENITKEENN